MKCKYLKMMVLGGIFVSAQAVFAAPYIFNITKNAGPGDVIAIQGTGFSESSSVWFDVVEPGESEISPELNLSGPELQHRSADFISAKIPADHPAGLYAVFVAEGDVISEAGWVNKAEGWHFLDLAGNEISSGFNFRISGRNLLVGGMAASVRFVSKATGIALSAEVNSAASNESILSCQAPAGLSVGQEYFVEVSNGAAEFQGAWSRVGETSLIARTGGDDLFGLGVPWAPDASRLNNIVVNVKSSPFNARGNGATDDRIAIQWAIDNVSSRVGGTVYLPAGTYRIGTLSMSGVDYNLIMRPNVVIKGEGINQTTIVSEGGAAGLHAGVVYILPSLKNVGLHSLTIMGGAKSAMVVNGLNCSRSFLVNCRLVNGGGVSTRAIAWREGGSCVFNNCEFISTNLSSEAPYFARHSDFVLKNCFFEYHDGRVSFLLSKRVQVEGCTFGRGETGPTNHINYGGLGSPLSDFTLLNSSFVKLGEASNIFTNDGEAVLCEYPSNNLGLGTISNASTTSVQDSSAAWQHGRLAGCEIVIIKGPGAGQRRTITGNTNNVITVSQPWQILPVPGESSYTVGELCERHLIKGCVFNDSPRGIWYYRTPVKDLVITDNSFMDTGYPVLVRANQRVLPESYSLGNEFNSISHLLVENNVAQTTFNYSHTEPVMISVDSVMTSGSALSGGFYYDCALRDNILCGAYSPESSGFYISLAAPLNNNHSQPSSVGMILQRNTVECRKHGITLGTGNHKTLILGTTLANTPDLLRDTALPLNSNASVDTVVGE